MDKMCWVWVMVLVAASLMVIPSAGAETREQEWLKLGADYTVNTTSRASGYALVGPGEVFTINYKSNSSSRNDFMIIGTRLPLMNWSSDFYQPYPPSTTVLWFYMSRTCPCSAWMRSSGFDMFHIDFGASSGSPASYVVNFTVTRDSGSFSPDMRLINGRFDALEAAVAGLNATISELSSNLTSTESSLGDLRLLVVSLKDSLAELNERFLKAVAELRVNQSEQYELIMGLQSSLQALNDGVDSLWGELEGVWGNETAGYQAVQEQLAALNSSLLEALGALRGVMELSDAGLWGEVAELQGKTTPEPEQYDDSALWAELEQLRGNVSVVYNNTMVNNTTVQQPVTYVNRTTVGEQDGSAVVGGAAAGFIGGAVAAGASVALYDRVTRRRQ